MNITRLLSIITEYNARTGCDFAEVSSENDKYLTTFRGLVDSVGMLRLAFSQFFPVELPDIFVESPSSDLLHIDKDGKLCLFARSSLLVDVRNPVEIITECVDRAIEILSLRLGSLEYWEELRREFMSYWGKDSVACVCFMLDTSNTGFAEVPILRVTGNEYVLSDSILEAERILCDVMRKDQTTVSTDSKALVIQLREDAEVPFPFENTTWQWFSHYLHNNIEKSHKKRLIKYLKNQYRQKQRHRAIIICIIPATDCALAFGHITDFRVQAKSVKKRSLTAMTVPLVICFNEPYEKGGHVAISNLSSDSCLQCLYSPTEGGELGFRGSFVESGQSFEKSLSGCVGAFVPYSCLDSQQTAIHAARAAVKVLNGKISSNCLISWKGDDAALIESGFITSFKYQSTNEGVTVEDDIKSDYCCVCTHARIEAKNAL